MDIYINERSFTGQGREHTLIRLMSTFAETLGILQQISPDAEIVVHSSLMARPLSDTLSLENWLFSQRYRGDDEEDGSDQAPPPSPDEERLQALIGVIRTTLISGPWIEDILDARAYICTCGTQGDDVGGSTIDGAAQRSGLLISLGDCEHYPDGPLTITYQRDGAEDEPREVAHFVGTATARACRRRYVPNPKHHPSRAKGKIAKMELDRAYDLFTAEREQELRDQTRDPWDTEVQRLLDRAIPGGKQLYARVRDLAGHHTYYEFQPDNPNWQICCFHGYPVPQQEVPAEVVRLMNDADIRSDAA